MNLEQDHEQLQLDGMEIVPGGLVLKAIRNVGFRNTAYALAELIDNSIQADATDVELFCLEERSMVKDRERSRLVEMAVLDNGHGMDPHTLRLACQFGNGTRLDDRSGIGRFGMGLPNSSVSQCDRMDVWSWQNGPDNAMRTYLDIKEIEGGQKEVPVPEHSPLPERWRNLSQCLGTTGTLVVWSRLLHRGMATNCITWATARATLKNTESEIGRIHRKFIDSGEVAIRLVSLEDGEPTIDTVARVNDPLYLMKDSSTPAPFQEEPMFEPYGEEQPFDVDLDGQKHVVVVRASIARGETATYAQETRGNGKSRGSLPYGKHAEKNTGVSVVREGRELFLDRGWSYETTDRWWGVELEFPAALDDLFGVTTSKQDATQLRGLHALNWEDEIEGNERLEDTQLRLKDSGDPREYLIPIAVYIRKQVGAMRTRVKKQVEGTRSQKRHTGVMTPEDLATKAGQERASQGYKVQQDEQTLSLEDSNRLKDTLVREGNPEAVAEDVVEVILKKRWKIRFDHVGIDSPAFFSIDNELGGLTRIILNTRHPCHQHLMETLEELEDEESVEALQTRLEKASDTVKLLLSAWARCEMEATSQQEEQLAEMRQDWGKMARRYLAQLGE